jgi:hypothetical protein
MVSHFHLKDIFVIKGLNIILVGKVVKGEIKIGCNLSISGRRYPVLALEFQKQNQKVLSEGQEGSVFIAEAENQADFFKKLKNQLIYFEN